MVCTYTVYALRVTVFGVGPSGERGVSYWFLVVFFFYGGRDVPRF